MKVTKSMVLEFKDLNSKVKSGKATPDEAKRASELAKLMLKSKPKGRDEQRGKPRGIGSATNEFAWYNEYPELIRDAANIVFNEVAGTYFPVGVTSTRGTSLVNPVVGALVRVCPTIGKSKDANDAFNYQMRDLWLKLHRAYRGVGTYEYADLGIVIFCIINAFANLARAERIYGTFNKFNARNRSYPKALLQALYIDPSYADTIQAGTDLADFRYQLNRLIAKAKLLCLPKGFKAFNQFISLMGNVFKDSDNVRAQWIVYDSPYTVIYDPASFSTGGSAYYHVRGVSTGMLGQTLSEVIDDLNMQFDALLNDTDVARICSDILKAFGEQGVQTLEFLPEQFEIEPIKDDVRLLQLHNTTIVGTPVGGNWSSAIETEFTSSFSAIPGTNETLRIYQEGGVVKQELFSAGPRGATQALANNVSYVTISGHFLGNKVPCMKYGELYSNSHDPLLDCWLDSPTQENIVEMTRQTVGENHYASGDSTYPHCVELDGYSTYVVVSINFYTGVQNVSGFYYDTMASNIMGYHTVATAHDAFHLAAALSHIDWHPYLVAVNDTGGATDLSDVLFDMDNYTLIPKQALKRIHEACTMSLFKLDSEVISSN